MTSNTDKLRAVFLTALMIGSVFAAGVAFTGGAAATATDVRVSSPVNDGNTVTPEVQADSTTNDVHVVLDANGDGYYNTSTDQVVSAGITSTGTWTSAGSAFTTAGLSADSYTLYAVQQSAVPTDGEDVSSGVTTTLSVQKKAPKFVGATEYTAAGSNDGDIEVSYSEGIYQNVSSDTALTSSNVTVYVNGNSYAVDGSTFSFDGAQDGTTGTLLLTSSMGISPQDEVKVNIDTLRDAAGNSVSPGNITVKTTSKTVAFSGSGSSPFQKSAYEGEVVAVNFANDNQPFEVFDGNTFKGSFSSGANSQVYAWNTNGLNTNNNWFINTSGTSNDIGDLEFNLRSLGLTASADDTSVTTETNITGTVTSNQGDSTVDVQLLDADDEAVDGFSQTLELDGSGEGSYDLGQVGEGNAGNYTVEVVDTATSVTATTDTIEVGSAADDSAEFVSNTRVTRGDVGTVNVSITGTETATVHIGSESNGYEANVTLTDGDGDGYVAFDVNTFTMGGAQGASTYSPGDAYSVVDSDDTISVASDETTTLPRVIAKGGYQMSVRASSDVTDSPQDLTQFYVAAGPSLNAQNIWTAPGTISLSNVADSGKLTQDSSIAWKDSPRGDYVVHQFDSPGVFGLIESSGSSGDSFATKAEAAFNNDKLNLTLTQTEASTNQNANPFQVNEGNLLGSSSSTIVSDAANDTFYVIYDVEAINNNLASSSRTVKFNDGINATVELSAKSNMTKKPVMLSSEYSIVEPSTELTYDGDELQIGNATNQTIAGTTNLADGTNVTITATSQETEGDGFIKSQQKLTVQNGEFSGSFDFSDAAVNDTFTVSVSDSQGNSLTSGVSGVVVEDAGGEQPTTTTADDSTTEQQTTEQQTTEQQTTEQQTTEQQTTEEQTTAAATTTSGDDGGSSSGSIPGFGVGIALVAILGAALLALRE